MFGAKTVDEPSYTVTRAEEPFEVREYDSVVLATTVVEGDFEEAQNQAFRRLFDYITGANVPAQKIEMTAPVLISSADISGDKNLPLVAERTERGWSMSFVLPESLTMSTAPMPTSELVALQEVEGKKVASIKFSGRWKLKDFIDNTKRLREWLEKNDIQAVSEPRIAAFNPPWTIPFLRRNEVHIDVR